MNTLLLRLAGPMQAWGVSSRFPQRDTNMFPSKSGVIGLLCAALGKPREERPDDRFPTLSELGYALKMGIREDREGIFSSDFQTALHVAKVDGKPREDPVISTRYYLADAAFLVGLESADLALLKDLQDALANPRWFLFLGRKSFVPSEPICLKDGLQQGMDLLTALQTYPWLGRAWQKKPEQLRFVIEHRAGDSSPANQPITQINDQPLSFDIHNRRYAPRRVRTIIEPPNLKIFEHLAERVGDDGFYESSEKEAA